MKKKGKPGRPPKKKVLESFIEPEIIPGLKPEDIAPVVDVPKCECGKPMHPNHHPHCWDCSHRA